MGLHELIYAQGLEKYLAHSRHKVSVVKISKEIKIFIYDILFIVSAR